MKSDNEGMRVDVCVCLTKTKICYNLFLLSKCYSEETNRKERDRRGEWDDSEKVAVSNNEQTE